MTKNKELVASNSDIITKKTTKKYYFIRPYFHYNNKVSKELKDRKTTTKSKHQKRITSDHAPELKRNQKRAIKIAILSLGTQFRNNKTTKPSITKSILKKEKLNIIIANP